MQPNPNLDVFPTISVGRKYGELVDNFDLDVGYIVERMREAGLTDEQITETSIHFSDAPSPSEGKYVTHGLHHKKHKAIEVFGADEVELACHSPRFLTEFAQGHLSDTVLHELEHRIANFDKEQQKNNNRYERKIGLLGKRPIAFILGGYAVANVITNTYSHNLSPAASTASSILVTFCAVFAASRLEKKLFNEQHFNEYVNSPEEQRARATEGEYPELVSLSLIHRFSNPEPRQKDDHDTIVM